MIMILVFGDEFLAQGLHVKSAGIRTWLSADQSSSSTLTESSFLFDPCLMTAYHLRRDDDNPSEMSPRDRSPVRTSSPRHPSGKDPWNQWTTYTLTLLQLEQTTDLSGRRGTGPPTEPGFSQGFFSPFCHRWSFRSLPLSPLACSVGDT